MKKILFIILLMVFVVVPGIAFAWDDCPYNEVDCEYPGECPRYLDTDSDGICDHSQSAPEDRNKVIEEVLVKDLGIVVSTDVDVHDLVNGSDFKTMILDEIANIYEIDATEYANALSEYYNVKIKEKNSFQFLHDNYGVEPNVAKDIALSIKTGLNVDMVGESKKVQKRVYHLIPIFFVLTVLYLITHLLSKKKVISIVNHRKIWNILLMITFLTSGLLGVLLVIKINFGTAILLPFNILYWHVELGIAMFAISVFHIIWHWSYFKNILKIKK